RLEVFHVRLLEGVNLARLERGKPRRGVGDHTVDDRIDVAGDLAPVVRVTLKRDVIVANPLDEPVRAGAGETYRGRAVGRAGFLDGCRAGDCEHRHGERVQHRAVWLAEREGHFVLTGRFDAGDDRLVVKAVPHARIILEHHFGEVSRVVRQAPAIEVISHGLGVERCAVVESHAFTKLEGPDRAVFAGGPAFGQTRLRSGRLVGELEQRLAALDGDAEGDTVGDDRWIKCDGVSKFTEGKSIS